MSDSQTEIPFEIGDPIRVKEGTEDSDYPGEEIGGWQGRIIEITDDDPPLLHVQWDSVTLEEMPKSVLREAKLDGFDWSRYYLQIDDVEAAEPRDSPQDVKRIKRKLDDELRWAYLDEATEELIRDIESQADSDDERRLLAIWDDELSDRLSFPFPAHVAEPQDDGPFQYGDEVTIKNILLLDSLYGILAVIQRGRSTKHLPLVDLEVADETSENRTPLRAYRNWFANR